MKNERDKFDKADLSFGFVRVCFRLKPLSNETERVTHREN